MRQPLPRNSYKEHLRYLDGRCAFCSMSNDLNIKIYENWILAYAAFPYRKYHTVLISKRHVVNFSELDAKELAEFAYITKDVDRIYRESGVIGEDSTFGNQLFFSWRSRDRDEVEKKSVFHLHLHFYPEIGKNISIVLDEKAWDIDTSLLVKKSDIQKDL